MMLGSRGWLAERRGVVAGLSEGLKGYTSYLYVGGLRSFQCFKGVVLSLPILPFLMPQYTILGSGSLPENLNGITPTV